MPFTDTAAMNEAFWGTPGGNVDSGLSTPGADVPLSNRAYTQEEYDKTGDLYQKLMLQDRQMKKLLADKKAAADSEDQQAAAKAAAKIHYEALAQRLRGQGAGEDVIANHVPAEYVGKANPEDFIRSVLGPPPQAQISRPLIPGERHDPLTDVIIPGEKPDPLSDITMQVGAGKPVIRRTLINPKRTAYDTLYNKALSIATNGDFLKQQAVADADHQRSLDEQQAKYKARMIKDGTYDSRGQASEQGLQQGLQAAQSAHAGRIQSVIGMGPTVEDQVKALVNKGMPAPAAARAVSQAGGVGGSGSPRTGTINLGESDFSTGQPTTPQPAQTDALVGATPIAPNAQSVVNKPVNAQVLSPVIEQYIQQGIANGLTPDMARAAAINKVRALGG